MSTRINNSYNMKLIRKAMIDLDLNNVTQLGKFLYMSESLLRAKFNGKALISRGDLEFMEYKLNIRFNWDEISHIKGHLYRFYDPNLYTCYKEVEQC